MTRLTPTIVLALIYLHTVSSALPILPYMGPIYNPVLPVAPIVGPYMNPMLYPMMRSHPLYNTQANTRRKPANNKVNILGNKGTSTTVRRGDRVNSFRRTNRARESSMTSMRNHVVGRRGGLGIGRP